MLEVKQFVLRHQLEKGLQGIKLLANYLILSTERNQYQSLFSIAFKSLFLFFSSTSNFIINNFSRKLVFYCFTERLFFLNNFPYLVRKTEELMGSQHPGSRLQLSLNLLMSLIPKKIKIIKKKSQMITRDHPSTEMH